MTPSNTQELDRTVVSPQCVVTVPEKVAQKELKTEPKSERRSDDFWARAIRSSTIVAVSLFLTINFAVAASLPHMTDTLFDLQNHDASWWAVKAFKNRPPADILMLGSSLMCRVVNEGDATYLKRDLNAFSHYRSQHLEDLITAIKSRHGETHDYTSASLAVGGMNVSDVATMVPPLLSSSNKPSIIVYGVGPRDFFDNSLESPADAPSFHLAEKLQQLPDDVQKYARPSREAQFQYQTNKLLRHFLGVYKIQEELAVWFRRQTQAVFDRLESAPAVCTLPEFDVTQKQQLHLLPSDVVNYCRVVPDDPKHPLKYDFQNNYYMSYNPFRPALYKRQLYFFDRFLKFAQDSGIKVVVVKMPLRADNFTLMVPNFYKLYEHDLGEIASRHAADVVDGADVGSFGDADFTDTVHLNGTGASKLVEGMASYVSQAIPESSTNQRTHQNRKTENGH
ncbi:MAG TPA: hypothetical protein V6C97_11395 [Oculatellaceae cyanobacterium]